MDTVMPGVQISKQQPDGTYMVLIWAMGANGARQELLAVAGDGLTHDQAEKRLDEVLLELEAMPHP